MASEALPPIAVIKIFASPTIVGTIGKKVAAEPPLPGT